MKQGEVQRKQIQYYSYAIGCVLLLMFGQLIGDNGLAYLAIGMETIGLFMIFLGENIADVYGKMIRYRRKRNQFHDVRAVKKRVAILQTIIGILFFVLVFTLSDTIADKIFGMDRAALIIRILAPVLLLRMVGTILIGYFQSFGAQMPVTITALLRQLLFWILGRLFCTKMLAHGDKVAALLKNDDFYGMYGAVGLAIAIAVTEVVLLVALVIYYFISDNGYDKKKSSTSLQKSEGVQDTLLNFGYLNTPGIVFALLKRLLIVIPFIVLTDAGVRGIFYGKYLVICAIPVLLVAARFQLLYARLVSVIKNRDNRMVREHIQVGVQYAWVIGIFAATMLSILAMQITDGFFGSDELLIKFLQVGTILIVPALFFAYFCMVHIAHGRRLECLLTALGTAILYIFLNNIMYQKMEQKPEAVIYAGTISLLLGALILGAITFYQFKVKPDYIPVFVLPLLCVAVTGVIVLFASKYLAPHIGNELCCFISIILGVVLYIASLGLCRVFSELEIEKLYGRFGKKILSAIFK